jgi:hypothetical protein
MRGWLLSVLFLMGVSLAMGAGVLAQAPGQPPPQKPGKEAPKKEPPKLETQVFRLQHCDPEEIRDVLHQLFEEEPIPLGGDLMPVPGGGLGMMGGGAGMLGMIGGFGMLGGPPPAPGPWRVSINARSATVIVRGRPQDLQMASDVVAVLDLPDGKAPPKVKTVQAIVLKHADAGELVDIIRDLELPVRVVALSEAKMIVGAGPEDALRDLGNLIQQLDLPERKQDEKKLKRLGVQGGAA